MRNLVTLFVLSLITLVPFCFGQVYTGSIPSQCVCLLQEDQSICNDPNKHHKYCALQTDPESCANITSGEKQLCYWRDTTNQNLLAANGLNFSVPSLISVVNGTVNVYVASGYGLANVVIFESSEGLVLIDTLESTESAAILKRDIVTNFPGKQVKGIVYLHSHPDHTQGGSVFITPGTTIPIITNNNTIADTERVSYIGEIFFQRGMKQFGNYLQVGPNGFLNNGIGPQLYYNGTSISGYVAPNTFVEGQLEVSIAGINFTLVNDPGETDDQLNLFVYDIGLAVVADNVYGTTPNLYAIRGTPPRDVKVWYQSIDNVLDFNPQYLIGTHFPPVSGQATIQEILLNYRDSIQYCYDKTRYYANQGILPRDIVNYVQLPPYLADFYYLQEFYGTVEFNVRAIFDGELGWFSGSPVDLFPLSTIEYSQRFISFGGGEDKAVKKARSALFENTPEGDQWALEISYAVLTIDPANSEALDIYINALQNTAYKQTSSNARNFLLTEVLLAQGYQQETISSATQAVIVLQNDVSFLLETFSINLNVTKTANIFFNTLFKFSDDDYFTVRIRRYVAEVRSWTPGNEPNWSYNLTITSNTLSFKTAVLSPTQIPTLISHGNITLTPSPLKGGVTLLEEFLGFF